MPGVRQDWRLPFTGTKLSNDYKSSKHLKLSDNSKYSRFIIVNRLILSTNPLSLLICTKKQAFRQKP